MAKWTSKSRADGATGAKQGRSSVAELRPPVHTLPKERPLGKTIRPARNLRDWPIDSLAKPASDLKCRCYQFQVLSRRLTLAGSRQDHLDAPTSVPPLIRVEQCGIIRLNVLQGTGQRVWLLGGRMHCKGTKTDNSHSNQHCRDQACSDFCLELVHKLRRVQAM